MPKKRGKQKWTRHFQDFVLGLPCPPCWERVELNLGRSASKRVQLGSKLRHVGPKFGSSWSQVGPSWAEAGAMFAKATPSWAHVSDMFARKSWIWTCADMKTLKTCANSQTEDLLLRLGRFRSCPRPPWSCAVKPLVHSVHSDRSTPKLLRSEAVNAGEFQGK